MEWFCSLIIGLELVFVVVAVTFWFTEPPRIIREMHRNPDCDSANSIGGA